MKNNLISYVAVMAVLSGCTMIPTLDSLPFTASKTWNDIPGYERIDGENVAIDMNWRDYFQSPELQKVIETALANNKDLKTAALNIAEARAMYRVERADLLPTVNANGVGTIRHTSDDTSTTGNGTKSETYEANVGMASYELDLFGKIQSQNEAALNDYLATEQAHAVVRNALIAEVANAYLQLLADRKLLSLTEQTLKAQEKTYNLLSQTLKLGSGTEQDVARGATAVETAKVNMHQYNRLVAQDENALFLLMGVANDDEFLGQDITLGDMKLADHLNAGVPSEVLLARPDVKQAEFELLSANANIGAARAAFFPSISLTGSYGFASSELGDLFSGGAAGAWSFIPQITLPIFEAGRNVANLDIAEIRKEKAVVNYEKAIQVAFRDVADELAARATLDAQLKAQRRLVSAGEQVYNKTYSRYQSGIDSFLSVLDAQRELYAYQQNEITTEKAYLSNLVNMYKVLGGQ